MSSKYSARKVSTKEKTSVQAGPHRSGKKKQAPPHYEVDTPSEQSDVESEILEELSASEAEDASRPVPKAAKKKGTTRNKKRETAISNKESSAVPAFMMMLAPLNSLFLHTVQYTPVSQYYPNFYSMFNVLAVMQELVAENTSLHRFCPFYISPLTQIYYAVIWIISILRAREAAHVLDQADFQFLRFFVSNFSLEELPVAGPLVLFFQNLGAYKPDTDRFNWVVPRLAMLGTNNAAGNPRQGASSYTTPNIPIMIDLLHKFGNSNAAQRTSIQTLGFFRPFTFAAGGHLAGFATGANFANNASILSLPGINAPWPHSVDTLLKKINVVSRLGIPDMAPVVKNTPRNFCGLGEHQTWFVKAITAAAHEAKYFSGSTTLANINPTTGPSTVVIATISTPATAIVDPTDWYPGNPFPLTADYYVRERTITDTDQKIGMFTNHNINVSHANFGSFQGLTDLGQPLDGPYFDAARNLTFAELGYEVNTHHMTSPTIMLTMYRPKGGEANADD